jgi:hypothetical protein
MQEVLQHLRIYKMHTTLLHLQSESMVERNIKKVKKHLRQVILTLQRDLDERLPLFLLAYRASTR